MNKMFVAIAACLLCSISSIVLAAEGQIVLPGMYEITSGIADKPIKTEACYSDADVKDLPTLLLKMEDKLMQKNCVAEILSVANRKAEWRTECKTQFVTRTTVGSIMWGDAHFSGDAFLKMGRIEMAYQFDARRVGDCQ
ncbi:DUF3617 domain-containing protein [Chitinimonas taiwanensis]|uniref:DUF3617 domain-containing protein n=1 Tax=Chitinimonas taiwanensis TaxID=240412 RepID=UPI0011147DB4|nr:DUF3617 family protein [Chitinimonas taiwanensis]